MDTIAHSMDEAMGKMDMARYSPLLRPSGNPQDWLSLPGSPKPARPEEKPETISYDKLIQQWVETTEQ
jgi:glycerol transport system substrate-binding protein